MDENKMNCCCISDEEAEKIKQGYMDWLTKKAHEITDGWICDIKHRIEELKKQNEELKQQTSSEALPAPVPSYGYKLLPCCCDCTEDHFIKDEAWHGQHNQRL